mmetsp:Transcript_47062/g.73646  ORF Transcript_47062/g.73646 Transcript_47062/m.73646 type:complete len:154 (+) Transcript_47062:77-538(+)
MGNEQSVAPGIDMCCAKRSNGRKDRRDPVEDGNWSKVQVSDKSAVKLGAAPANDSVQPNPEKVGIGAYFQKSADEPGALAVKSLVEGPAKKDGRIKMGDIIVSVNDIDVYSKRLAELAEHLLGPKGSDVRLTFKSKNNPNFDELYTVTLTRGL